jgi:hypothetical protein
MTTQQIYGSNTLRPFPLQEGNTLDMSNDILIDMSITVPYGVTPVVTAIAMTRSTFFLAVEDDVSKNAVGQILIHNPSPFSVYKFDMPMSGAYGWIVPGPGIRRDATYTEIDAFLDPAVVMTMPPNMSAMRNIVINGIEYDIEGLLGLVSGAPSIKISTGVRDIIGSGNTNCIILSRNDEQMGSDQLYYSFTESTSYPDAIYRIGGVVPDASGNIDIETGPATFHVSEIVGPASISDNVQQEVLGLLFNQSEEVCIGGDMTKRILHGRCEQGIVCRLPDDGLVEALRPEFLEEDCGCSAEGIGEDFSLTVDSGSGSGNYKYGSLVSIAADTPEIGHVFDQWTGNIENLLRATGGKFSETTSLIMPNEAITLTATYKLE